MTQESLNVYQEPGITVCLLEIRNYITCIRNQELQSFYQEWGITVCLSRIRNHRTFNRNYGLFMKKFPSQKFQWIKIIHASVTYFMKHWWNIHTKHKIRLKLILWAKMMKIYDFDELSYRVSDTRAYLQAPSFPMTMGPLNIIILKILAENWLKMSIWGKIWSK